MTPPNDNEEGQMSEPDLFGQSVANASEEISFSDSEEDPSADPSAAPAEDTPHETEPAETPEESGASEDGQPEEGEAPSEGTEDSTQPAEESADSEEAEESAADEEERLRREALGLTDTEPITLEVAIERMRASARGAHEVAEDRKVLTDILAERYGLQWVETADGEKDLVPNAEFFKNLQDEDVPDVYRTLSPEEQDVIDECVCQEITKRAVAAERARHPYADTDPGDVRLSNDEVDDIVFAMQSEKLSNGREKFPDLADPKVQNMMLEIYNDPSFAPFAAAMNQSPANFRNGLAMVYARVANFLAPVKARKADAEAQRKAQDKTKRRDASVSVDAASQSVASPEVQAENDAFGRQVAYADIEQ